MTKIPIIFLEFLVVVFFCISIIIFNLGGDYEKITYAGFYAIFFIKLLQPIYQISTNLQSLLYSKGSINKINNDLDIFRRYPTVDFKKNLVDEKKINYLDIESIEINDLSFKYSKDVSILDKVKASFERGKTYCIKGYSGSGKTTLINLIMGFLEPIEGNVYLNKQKINFQDNNTNFIDYLSQEIFLLGDPIKNNIAFGVEKENIYIEKIKEKLTQVGLDGLVERLDEDTGDNGEKLSVGQKQRIGIARKLYFDRPVLILDELTSALDEVNENKILNIIDRIKKNKIIIVITHSDNVIRKCDHVYNLENRKLIKVK